MTAARGLAVSFAMLCLLTQPTWSAVVIGGVKHPVTLDVDDLKRLPPVTVAVAFETAHGTESGTYTGALLWTVLDRAGFIDDPGKNARFRHAILVTGSDGYGVALSEGEIDPLLEAKSVILAYEKDGKPLSGGGAIRLIVPGDKHGGRAVRDVASVTAQ